MSSYEQLTGQRRSLARLSDAVSARPPQPGCREARAQRQGGHSFGRRRTPLHRLRGARGALIGLGLALLLGGAQFMFISRAAAGPVNLVRLSITQEAGLVRLEVIADNALANVSVEQTARRAIVRVRGTRSLLRPSYRVDDPLVRSVTTTTREFEGEPVTEIVIALGDGATVAQRSSFNRLIIAIAADFAHLRRSARAPAGDLARVARPATLPAPAASAVAPSASSSSPQQAETAVNFPVTASVPAAHASRGQTVWGGGTPGGEPSLGERLRALPSHSDWAGGHRFGLNNRIFSYRFGRYAANDQFMRSPLDLYLHNPASDYLAVDYLADESALRLDALLPDLQWHIPHRAGFDLLGYNTVWLGGEQPANPFSGEHHELFGGLFSTPQHGLALAPATMPPAPPLQRQSRQPAQQRTGSLSGRIVDPLGGLIVSATVIVRDSSGTERTATTNGEGRYRITGLAPGLYNVRATALGFAVYENLEVRISGHANELLDIELHVAEIASEEVTVADESPLSRSSLTMRVLRGRDLDALPDGPGGLHAALRVLAPRSVGPRGPQIIVDGFSGGRLPPRRAIREIRISQNPFSAEYEQPGFDRIEILTRPGANSFQVATFFNFNDESLNSRNPFALDRPPFQARFYGGSLSGPIIANRSSFFVDFERQEINDNATINANIVDAAFNIVPFNLAALTPQRRTIFSPRFDYQLGRNHTLIARYSYAQERTLNAGVGDFSLPSRAYTRSHTEQILRLTETTVLSQRSINETRLQYIRERRREEGDDSSPTINVPEAFIGGGAQAGLSFNREDRFDLMNYSTLSLRQHTVKFGFQLRRVSQREASSRNFGGTYTFAGGIAPQLDASNRAVRDARGQMILTPITGLERYRRTLLLQQQGLAPAEIRALGGGATQFSIAGGNPEAQVTKFEAGAFLQDDWQLRPNLTLSLGLRYERQSNIRRPLDFAPRLGVAWAPGGGNQSALVVRGGIGVFYDRFSENYTLQARRFNGRNQQQFIVTDPDILALFPARAPVERLTAFAVPQATTQVAENLRTPYIVQSAASIERQLPGGFSLAVTYINSRTFNALRSRNINAPLPASPAATARRPLADAGDIFQYESSGRLQQNQMLVNVSHQLRSRMTLWATYTLNKTRGDTDDPASFPMNSHDLRGEYGRSTLDIRHSLYVGGWIQGPWGLQISPLLFFRTGVPYNITTGRDTNGDSLFTERPAFATDLTRSSVVITRLGAFDLDPLPGQTIIPRNYGTGPAFFTTNLRVSRTFRFGPEPRSGAAAGAGASNREIAQRIAESGGNPLTRWLRNSRYNLTLSLQVENLFNRTNRGTPVGNLSSPLFGNSYSAAGAFGVGTNPAGNRRIDVQVAFTF